MVFLGVFNVFISFLMMYMGSVAFKTDGEEEFYTKRQLLREKMLGVFFYGCSVVSIYISYYFFILV